MGSTVERGSEFGKKGSVGKRGLFSEKSPFSRDFLENLEIF